VAAEGWALHGEVREAVALAGADWRVSDLAWQDNKVHAEFTARIADVDAPG